MSNFNEMVSSFVNTNSRARYSRGMRAKTSIIEDAPFINAMKEEQNWKRTENGAQAKSSLNDKLYDLFALGGAYRSRGEADCVLLFKEAYLQNPEYALKCLWYLRDILEGQGERRFFRVCLRWLAAYDKKAVLRNLDTIARDGFGRWDDLFVLFDTDCEQAVMDLIQKQLGEDMYNYQVSDTYAVSLCAKWMPSCNASSTKTKHNARKICHALNISERDYRKMLSTLRERIKVVERLMSQNRWGEIQFDKLPSRAGLIYRKAFQRRDLIAEKYKAFAQDENTTVNADALYPYDVVLKARDYMSLWSNSNNLQATERLMINKYWENLTDVFNGAKTDMMVVCDTSASMTWSQGIKPIDVAVSLAMYAAEHAEGPFKNHYISFSHQARLVEVKGVDFCDKVARIVGSNLCEDTNLESVFDLVLNTAMQHKLPDSAVPKTLVIVSDMEVNSATDEMCGGAEIFMDSIRRKWEQRCGGKYAFPNIVYWNVEARQNTFIDNPRAGVTFVSGASPVLFEQVVKGVSGEELMFQKLNSPRYKDIH